MGLAAGPPLWHHLVDLATHRVVDLLPARSAASVAAWLAQHPTIQVVCRDRSDLYADGICRGTPEVVQVVDRFHLVQNLRQALEAVLFDYRPAFQAAAVGTAMALTQADHMQLWREIQTLGYAHSARTVCRCITRLRRAADAGHPPESQRPPYMCPQGPSARAVSFVMVGSAVKRSAEAQTYLDQLCQTGHAGTPLR